MEMQIKQLKKKQKKRQKLKINKLKTINKMKQIKKTTKENKKQETQNNPNEKEETKIKTIAELKDSITLENATAMRFTLLNMIDDIVDLRIAEKKEKNLERIRKGKEFLVITK